MEDKELRALIERECGPVQCIGDMLLAVEVARAAMAAERERCAAVARRWGETHEAHVTVNARNAADKIARAIEGPSGPGELPASGGSARPGG